MRFAIVRLVTEMRSMLACQRGQVAIIFAFAVVMLFIAVGMGIDLWQAYAVKARLQSAVDAAALAIASTDRTLFTTAQLQARVESYVTANYPASSLGTPGTPKMGPTLDCDEGAIINVVNVCDTASVPTTFMRIIGVNTLSVSTVGQAKAAWPYIDFYLLLDSSPSMAIAATQAGINTMVANTQQQCDAAPAGGATCGCGFACHETRPDLDSHCSATSCGLAGLANKNLLGVIDNTIDNFQLSKNLGVTLRIDNLRIAAADLMTTAQTTETTNGIVNEYRMAIYTFDVAFNTIQTLTSNLATAATAAANIQLLTMYNNNHLVAGDSNLDADTNYTNAMTQINAIMPNPGHGTQSPGDTPKEVLFFVTDGLQDEKVASCTPVAGSVTCSNSNKRKYAPMDPTLCTTIKNRGILIAVLYTEYLPLPTNGWYNTYVKPFQTPVSSDKIATAMESCASPGLYTEVLTGGDISAALKQLFILAVNAVYLSH
jgi:Flp pilus assembly protein TadG